MARRISPLASAALYWASFVGVALLALTVSSWYLQAGADGATQGDSGNGMAAGYLLLMSPFATLGHSGMLGAVNWWRRRRNVTDLSAAWIPVLSACLWLALGYAGLSTLFIPIVEFIFGWNSEWALVILPGGIAAVGTGICVLLATVRGSRTSVQPGEGSAEAT
jgi:hypothetical protein